ncbi:MAG: hypothetical protein JRI88_02865 [Deltaproteobacteria bacterium]|nr:hypothetical protein [Deltaproteobacteria bacterium]MBW1940956.1 hypothetical protein [Deltaproteobacteria bacterium]
MKQYVIDEIRPEDFKKIKAYLNENFGPSTMRGIYWIPVHEDILTDVQTEHSDCRPFYFAVDLEENLMACELLVRAKTRVKCNCISYATEKQRNWFIGLIDDMFEKLGVIT